MKRNCQKTRDHICDWISGTLPEAEEQALRQHLDSCTNCRQYAQALEQEDTSLTNHFAQLDAAMPTRQARVLRAVELLHTNRKTDVITTWKRIMGSRYGRLTAVAAAVVVALVAAHWFGAGTAAYGLTEALEYSQNAGVIHIRGWYLHQSADNGAFERLPFEHWTDRKNGCYKQADTIGYADSDPNRPIHMLRVSDAEYVMDTSYSTDSTTGQITPWISYTKLGPFQQRLRIHTMVAFPEFMEHLSEVKGFARVGRERIKGTITDVWEGEIIAPAETVPYTKLRIWLSPSTGQIHRILRWKNTGKDAVQWVLGQDTHTIEYDITPPKDCFNTDPPDGYELDNTKATAVTRELGDYDGRGRFYTCVGFTLNDGTVILGWHANHEPQESQARFFANLKPTGPLPQLPARIVALKPWPMEEDTTLAGRHLAWTKKNGKFYEWDVYVADREMPKRSAFLICTPRFGKPASSSSRFSSV